MSDSNAKAEMALQECLGAVAAGAQPKSIAPTLLAELGEQLRDAFRKRMQHPGVWDDERVLLLRMAGYLGTFARFYSDCALANGISKAHLWRAAKVVQNDCPVGPEVNGTKAWCKGADFSE